jgi:hypothetical protein
MTLDEEIEDKVGQGLHSSLMGCGGEKNQQHGEFGAEDNEQGGEQELEQSRMQDQEQRGWSQPRKRKVVMKKAMVQNVKPTRQSSRMVRDLVPISEKASKRMKVLNNTTAMEGNVAGEEKGMDGECNVQAQETDVQDQGRKLSVVGYLASAK